eukprot:s331_g14.t2
MLIEELDEEPTDRSYTFHHLPDAKFSSFGSPEIQPFFDKWGFGPDMAMCTFRVEQKVTSETFQTMLDAFFKDRLSPPKVSVRWQPMSTKVVSMSFFNKLEEAGCIGSSGHIRGRLEEDWEDVPIVNLIREAILMEESELYDTFSEQDRREFLFRIFQHLIFGGASNQYEDHVEDYFTATKAVYKDLLSVRRSDTGDVEVLSTIGSIVSLGDAGFLYPKESVLNFCYIIHDPVVRHVKVWYFGFRPLW